jgi:hypothetical protein
MTKASLQAAQTASVTPTAHAMTVDAVRRRQQRLPRRSTVGLDRPCSLTLRTRSWPHSSTRMTRRSRRWGTVLPTTGGGLHGRCPFAHTAECAASLADQHARRLARHGISLHPVRTSGWTLGWTRSRKLAPVWHSPRMPGQRRRRPAIAAAAQLAEEVGSGVPDLLTLAWQALLDELRR